MTCSICQTTKESVIYILGKYQMCEQCRDKILEKLVKLAKDEDKK